MRPNKFTLIAMIVLFALAVLIGQRNQERLFAERGVFTVRQEEGVLRFRWNSEVEAPMAARLEETFRTWARESDHIVLDLNSSGGAITEGRAVINVIRAMKETHRVDTFVGANKMCLSMCVPIFLQGETRMAARSSVFMFHEPTAYDAITEERVNEPEFERRRSADRFFEEFFVNSAMEPTWREQLRKSWQGRDVWKTGRELVNENANIVTALE